MYESYFVSNKNEYRHKTLYEVENEVMIQSTEQTSTILNNINKIESTF